MTREHLELIVREWQRRLNIPHWRVTIDWDEPANENNYAEITRTGALYEGARMRLEPGYETWPLELANELIAHELMHAVMFDLQAAVESAEEVMTGAAFKLFEHRFVHELEGVVDRLALMLVHYAGVVDPTDQTDTNPDPAREETTYVFSTS